MSVLRSHSVCHIEHAIVRNSSAKAAVEIALYDLYGQLYNAPLYKLLGGGDMLYNPPGQRGKFTRRDGTPY